MAVGGSVSVVVSLVSPLSEWRRVPFYCFRHSLASPSRLNLSYRLHLTATVSLSLVIARRGESCDLSDDGARLEAARREGATSSDSLPSTHTVLPAMVRRPDVL